MLQLDLFNPIFNLIQPSGPNYVQFGQHKQFINFMWVASNSGKLKQVLDYFRPNKILIWQSELDSKLRMRLASNSGELKQP